MASPVNPGKTMSSRLLTMKFMQRAAASPTSLSNSATTTPDSHRSKRLRYSGGAPTVTNSPSSHSDAINAALAIEEEKRAKAAELEAERAGETRWVFSFQDPSAGKGTETDGALRVVTGGYADIDDSDDEPMGRFSFGKRQSKADSDTEKEESGEEGEDAIKEEDNKDDHDDDYDDDDDTGNEDADPAATMIKEERKKALEEARLKLKQRRKDKDKKMARAGADRRKKSVKLNVPKRVLANGDRHEKLTEVRRDGLSKAVRDMSDVVCHRCKKPGHMKAECPLSKRMNGFGGGGGLKLEY
ncbi:hypothetical protein EJ05DRAFT_489615 [Pseudovirgaria hyperparasitica]|uniref:CCHC-type domain-containing protein n=1 Tax=Pseudovirgaria hyperparasitica TaxID=470096 RepID=A0A6A6VVK6_9PEZI|nr:uncharacterized protein EJ05DRAFT_489615 [Pseudovirgaria hyperparasitica]KAF2753899.1 hypothetical protein EJ05DRAFT_489615 [Pseudovirgaria hyperparasitica]